MTHGSKISISSSELCQLVLQYIITSLNKVQLQDLLPAISFPDILSQNFFYTICTLLRLIEIKNRRGTIPYNWKFTVSSDTPWFLTLALSGNFTLGRQCGGPDYSRNTALSLETSLETKTHEVHLIGPTGQRDIFTSNSVPVERIC